MGEQNIEINEAPTEYNVGTVSWQFNVSWGILNVNFINIYRTITNARKNTMNFRLITLIETERICTSILAEEYRCVSSFEAKTSSSGSD